MLNKQNFLMAQQYSVVSTLQKKKSFRYYPTNLISLNILKYRNIRKNTRQETMTIY